MATEEPRWWFRRSKFDCDRWMCKLFYTFIKPVIDILILYVLTICKRNFQQHQRMHVWVPSELFPHYCQFECHKNYTFSNFNVEAFVGSNKCFEADIHIVLTTSTIVEDLPDLWGLIPYDIFYFTNLASIHQSDIETTYFIGK